MSDKLKEIWKETEFKGYWISDLGRLRNDNFSRNGQSKKFPLGFKTKRGYLKYFTGFKTVFAHRLVAKAFVKGDSSLSVNHKNGIKDDNVPNNLEWVTTKQNIIHSRDVLKRKYVNGSRHGRSKLKLEDIIEIRILKMSGMLQKDIAKEKRISTTHVHKLLTNKRWSHL